MDLNTRKQCAAQLQGLASALAAADDQSADTMILDICAALMARVDANPAVNTLDREVFEERLANHLLIYSTMQKFMTAAAETVDITSAQKKLMEAEKLYQEQCDAKKIVEEQHSQLTAKKQTLTDAVQKLYAENDGLLRQVKDLNKEQQELQQLKTTSNAADLENLRTQVAILQEDTDYLKEQYSSLDKQTAETLDQLANTLAKLGQLSKVNFKATETARKEAEEFKTAIELFCRTNEEFQSWFRGIQSPLKAMEKMIGKEEARNLQGVMTHDELKQKNELVARVEQDLIRLNQLATACAKAAGKDYTAILHESER